jgi:glutamate/tyrosine decarboxylase-like PLP-dependent enzyme
MGQDGYMKIARGILDTTEKIISAIDNIDGIKIATTPDMTAFAIISDDVKVINNYIMIIL